MTTWTIGVDTGGTFTDFYARRDQDGLTLYHKRPSTPHDPSEAILSGLAELCAREGIDPRTISRFAHGTTVATNALIQHRGGRVALVVTEGFRDLLEIGRQVRPLIYDMQVDNPPPLVPRELRFEVAERITKGGVVVTPLTEAEIARVVETVTAANVDAVAICTLFAFANADHEARLAAALRAALPGVHVSASHEVQPEFREYERLSTTVLNAWLQPVMHGYLAELEQTLKARAPDARLGINQSSGGLISAPRARELPIRTALSGPAAGVAGAIAIARAAGEPDIITLDIGGTSSDVCLIRGLTAETTHDRWIEGYPVRLASVDINAVGAGGGSLAWMDRGGLMKVGPQSAGAVPGPACYSRGGTEPTVSDANLVLGRLSPELLNGAMVLDAEKARAAIAPLSVATGLSLEHAALGVVDIVVANMVRAIRTISVERGHDPRDFTLMAFGGAGALHASAVARALGIRRVLIPLHPGLFCAEGLVVSDQRENFVRTRPMALTQENLPAAETVLAELAGEADDWFVREDIPAAARGADVTVDIRYVGQNFELGVPVAPGERLNAAALTAAFFTVHDRVYGFHNAAAPIELVNFRLSAIGRTGAAPDAAATPDTVAAPKPMGARPVWFGRDACLEAAIYHRDALVPGQSFVGPAIVDQLDATTVIFPGDRVTVDASANLLIDAAE